MADVAKMQVATQHIMPMVRDQIEKGWKQLPNAPAKRSPKTWMYDPLTLQYSLGYKDRRFSLTYDNLKRVVSQLGILNAIINTRIGQICAFAQPYRTTRNLGYAIKHKDSDHKTTTSELAFIKELENFIQNCGRAEPNPYSRTKRDDFEDFLKKLVRDTLTYDQMCCLPGTLVELHNGVVAPIENVKKGDLVRTHEGNVQPVVDTYSRDYSGMMVDVYVRAQKLSVTETHPLLVCERVSKKGNTVELSSPKWIAAADVDADRHYITYKIPVLGNDYVTRPIFDKPPRKYPTGDMKLLAKEAGVNPQTAYQILNGYYKKNGPAVLRVKRCAEELGIEYKAKRLQEPTTIIDELWGKLIGLYLAEGNIQHGSVRFTFHADETDLVSFVKDFGCKYGINSTDVPYPGRDGFTVILNSKALADFLKKECGTGSGNKRIPNFIFDSPSPVRDSLLGGYLLGDSHIDKHTCVFGTTSRNLFTGLRILFAANNIYVSESITSYKNDKHEERRNWSDKYNGSLGGPYYRSLAEKVGIPVTTPRTESKQYHIKDQFLCVKVSSVDKYAVSRQKVHNLEVKEDHSYIAEGMINHNCAELIPDRLGIPYEFYAVDASTIRLASDDRYVGVNSSFTSSFSNELFPGV